MSQQARHVLNQLAHRLAEACIDGPRRDANLILQMAIGHQDTILSHHDISLDDTASQRLEDLMARRIAGCPVSRLRGMREFYSLPFIISDATLDPRPDSELLVEQTLGFLKHKEGTPVIADFGTGSGCLLLAVLANHPSATGIGIDISQQALGIAAENASQLGLSQRSDFICSDWDQRLASYDRFDVIIANPPYIAETDKASLQKEVRDYDPPTALFAGQDGLSDYRQLMPIIAKRLKDGGAAFVEIGQHQQDDVIAIAQAAGLICTSQEQDLAGIIRCLIFHKG